MQDVTKFSFFQKKIFSLPAVRATITDAAPDQLSAVLACSTDDNGHINLDLSGYDGLITVRVLASMPGQGLPKGVTVPHALPKHLPFCLMGRDEILRAHRDIEHGAVLWFADADVTSDVYWKMSFEPLFARLERSTSLVERAMTYEECLKVFGVLRACNPPLDVVTPRLVRHTLIGIWKRPYMPLDDVYEETLVLLLRKLAVCLQSRKCPHLLYPSVNVAAHLSQDEARSAAALLEKLARILWVRPERIVDYTTPRPTIIVGDYHDDNP